MAIVIEVEEERWNDDEFSFFFLSNRAIIVMLPCEPRLANDLHNSLLQTIEIVPSSHYKNSQWRRVRPPFGRIELPWPTMGFDWEHTYRFLMQHERSFFWFWVVLNLLRRWLMSYMKIMSIYFHIWLQRYSNENWYKLTTLSTPSKKYKCYRIVQFISLMLYDENSGIISVYLRAW